MNQDWLESEQGEDIPYAIGRYRLVHKVGEGATGVVYMAVDTGLGREVALKLLHGVIEPGDAGETSVREWFRRDEWRRFFHTNLVKVYDRGEENGHPYVVMEWLEGETLKTTLARGGSVAPDEARRIVADVGKGVASAHQNGLVHGDIKPGNVFLCRSGTVKLLDLGLAPLEQAVDPRWDVFSLGGLLYELTAVRGRSNGGLPFQVAELFAGIVGKAMAKRLEDRYQTAADLVNDLERVRHPREAVPVTLEEVWQS